MTPCVGVGVRRAVPTLAVLAVGEDPDREHAEGAADAVHRDRADRVVDLRLALENQTDSTTIDAGDARR